MIKRSEELKRQLLSGRRQTPKEDAYLHTGSTMLNLAITGDVRKGFGAGTYVLFVGDTSSGKTWLSHACFAEACLSKRFQRHRLIYDNSENGALMDLEFYFGKAVVERLEAPSYTEEGEPIFSRTLEDMYYHLDDAIEDGRPFIFVEDSIDALTSMPEEKKFDAHKRASRRGKSGEEKGDYGDGKAKISSRNLRKVVGELERTDSILIILNQTRDNVGGGLFEPKKTRSGGRAMEFYAHVELWASVGGHITKEVKGKKRELGIISKVKVKKNRFTGRMREAQIPILHSYGIDNTGSMVDYLVEEGTWKRTKNGIISVSGIGPEFTGRRESVIKRIEQQGMIEDVEELVQGTWNAVEKACVVERERRYK